MGLGPGGCRKSPELDPQSADAKDLLSAIARAESREAQTRSPAGSDPAGANTSENP
jgi:hypothetical protein